MSKLQPRGFRRSDACGRRIGAPNILIVLLDDLEITDDTRILYIIGDNGASAEGSLHEPVQRQGAIRSQFHHVIDVAPALLEGAGMPEPAIVNRIQQAPIEDFSMLETLKSADAPENYDLQCFELFCNRGALRPGGSDGSQAGSVAIA